MKTSVNWLRAYTQVPEDLSAWQSRMIMTGTAVESVEPLDQGLSGVVAGRVLTCEKHENSDHLHVCTVDVGADEPLQIVCGAPNVAAGQLVPTALVGATLPGGMVIKSGKIRGVESFGMLCSATELNVPQELYPSVGEAGLLILQDDLAPGTDVRAVLGLDDAILDVEVLANRPDCLSVWGVARESAAVYNTPFKLPALDFDTTKEETANRISVRVEDIELCPRYAGRVVHNVRIGPSPRWMQRCLHAAGMRPINNIVDITNFVMLETGHPMHAFDLSQVRGNEIVVRRAKPGEKLTTLDEKQHDLTGAELLICDGVGPTGLAGIMGGLDSEITENTRSIFFECASFDRTNTRIAARGLGIRTESSGRFEKGVSPLTVMQALDRACHLVQELQAGEIASGVIDVYPNPAPQGQIVASAESINRLTGVPLKANDMKALLERLGFDATVDGDRITAQAPPWRQDIELEADLAEEVLRLAGYEHIPSTLLRGETTPGRDSENRRRQSRLARILNGLGYDEIINFSFFGKKQLDTLGLSADDPRLNALPIRNPLGEDTALMRTTLVPDMLKTLALNMNRGNKEGLLYEFGTLFDTANPTAEGLPNEQPWLMLGAYGAVQSFYTLRDTVLTLMEQVGAPWDIGAHTEPYLHPGRSAAILSGKQAVTRVGEVHPDTADQYGMEQRAWIAEVNVRALFDAATPMAQVKDLPRQPAVERDIALVLPEAQPLLPVLQSIRRAGGQLM